MNAIRPIRQLFHDLDFQSTGKWFVLSALIGIVAGVGAIVFQYLGQAIAHFTLWQVAGFSPGEPAGEHSLFEHGSQEFQLWALVAVMAVGGLLSGFLVYTFAPEAEGHGTDAAIDAFHNKRGVIRGRTPIIKTLASAITIGTGGSAGREGPIAQIGAGFGSLLASRMKLSARDQRIIMAAGMGAGVGSIFRAPLAGALFAGEILYRDADLESDTIAPAAISSIIGYSVYCLSLPPAIRFTPLFGTNLKFALNSSLELIPYGLLSIVLALAGIVYIKVFYGTHRAFQMLPVKRHFRPAIGAGLAGLVAIAVYFYMGENADVLGVLSTGYGVLQRAVSPSTEVTIGVLLVVACVKILTTSLTISSGGSGGVFGPSMVIGGCLGAAVGQYFHMLWPSVVTQPKAFAIVGMAGFFAGAARAPFSTVIMVSEMTGDYNMLLPTMWVSMLCFLLCRKWTLYEKQVPTRLDSPAHRGDFIIDVLEGIKVDEVYQRNPKIMLVPESMSLDEIVHSLAENHQHYFPVVDEHNRVVGIFSSDDVRAYLYDETLWRLANARDIMVSDVLSVTPEDDLNTALKHFTAINADELPVLSPNGSGRLLGMLRRKETIAFYNRRLMEHKHASME